MPARTKQRPHQPRPLVVRNARPADADALVELAKDMNPAGGFTLAAAKRDLFGRKPLVHALVAQLDGVLVGFAFLVPGYDSTRAMAGFTITDMHVTVAGRARGVSAALLAACAAHARGKGGAFLWWTSPAWDVDGQEFYRKAGAREEPVMAHVLEGQAFGRLADAGAL
jgi:GNAT superfamily N-acetyltransferase